MLKLGYLDRLVRQWKWSLIISRFFTHVYYKIFTHQSDLPYCQLETTTTYNRYPKIFRAVSHHLNSNSRVLSFGCSTGEECDSIALYLPKATVVGTDINSRAMAKAKAKNKNHLISFLSINQIKDNAMTFDAIFACSVLCRWPESKFLNDLTKVFSYESFFQVIKVLDSLLNEGGLLIIINSNYRFEETSLFQFYEVCDFEENKLRTFVHLFDRSSSKINSSEPSKELPVVFKKIRNS